MKRLRKVSAFLEGLNKRERVLLGGLAIGLFLAGCYYELSVFRDYLTESQQAISERKGQLGKIAQAINRYQQLDQKLQKLQATFNQSQISYEEVTRQVDSIVKTSIGRTSDYELKRTREPVPFGDQYQRHEYNLRINNITLQQLVTLLYNFEQGQNPFFLGKVDVAAGTGETANFTVVLDLSSINRGKAS